MTGRTVALNKRRADLLLSFFAANSVAIRFKFTVIAISLACIATQVSLNPWVRTKRTGGRFFCPVTRPTQPHEGHMYTLPQLDQLPFLFASIPAESAARRNFDCPDFLHIFFVSGPEEAATAAESPTSEGSGSTPTH